ncbi:FtsP/CotA-like multicopper oxidase with cupredoxin domain [Nocardioides albertanoniae]|uniref:Multicopper oxidase CueO n=1 Tax=Nocardioides albertanoniae TaxID=1175486 RepID=A0A543A110_9ACTN|nr:multicopper oxidase domain-containing protein [Nocardioides albertanoniae]TQL66278.1 FtsP/CotA-like multicopper oxidase with cupredoxin domain [Nocardioides albertanoniae]
MKLGRRTLLGATLAAPAAGALTSCGEAPGQTGKILRSAARLPKAYETPLPLPPIKRPAGGVIEIAQRTASVEILPGLKTEMMTYDGVFPGPTLETRRDQAVTVRHTNSLTLPTATHLHGGHTPAESDGWPTDLLVPDGFDQHHAHHAGHETMADPKAQVRSKKRDYRYPLEQPATTLWYHDHRMDFTGPQVWRGLAGFHIIRDDEEDALSLPRGEREIPLMIADRAFAEDGALRYPALDPELLGEPGVDDRYMAGVLGDVVLVNGAPWPEAEVEGAQHRLRLLNASNARRYELSLRTSDGKSVRFTQIGSDGGLLSKPVEHAEITMAPGERFDVVVDFGPLAPGTTVEMRNGLGTGRTAQVMRFRVTRRAADDVKIPDRLVDVPYVEKPDGAVVRRWHFRREHVHGRRGWGINGKPFAPAVPQARVPLGSTEIWEFYTDAHHPVHVHLSPFQVLRRGNRGPGPMDLGWKDTVDVRPYEAVRVRVRFERYAGRFLIHCHNLEHEDMAMMAGFETE